MTVKAFAKKFDISEDEMWDALKDVGYLKNDYSPKTKYVNDELFDEDSNIIDSKTLTSEMTEYFGSDEDEESEDDEYDDKTDEEESEDDDESDEEEDEDDDEDNEVTIDSINESIDNLSCTKDELVELIKTLTDKLANFSDESENEDEDYDDEEEEETPKSKKSSKKESSTDPNAEGKYRGWTITKKGISITATKGKKKLTTSIRGNIRAKIDEVED